MSFPDRRSETGLRLAGTARNNFLCRAWMCVADILLLLLRNIKNVYGRQRAQPAAYAGTCQCLDDSSHFFMSKADNKSPLTTASAAVFETLRRSFRSIRP